jgi:hypothetical protein
MSTVADPELLARFIPYRRWIRSSDQTVRQDAFIPYPQPELSITRHNNLSEAEIWEVGKAIVEVPVEPPRTLHGRADFIAGHVRFIKLRVDADPMPENPNHAIIVGWPPDKPSQKILAQELAAGARFVPKP